jgi:hypothetical protein
LNFTIKDKELRDKIISCKNRVRLSYSRWLIKPIYQDTDYFGNDNKCVD